MTMPAIIAISVLVYIVAGMALAVLVILMDGEPGSDDPGWILALVLFWPILMLIVLPIAVAQWIKSRREASRDKPRVYAENDL